MTLDKEWLDALAEPEAPEEIEVRLVPVEVFGAGCDDPAHEDQTGYGLCDAVQAWSDCNRAEGHIYRFDDGTEEWRIPGETLRIRANREEYEAFASRFWGDRDGQCRRELLSPEAPVLVWTQHRDGNWFSAAKKFCVVANGDEWCVRYEDWDGPELGWELTLEAAKDLAERLERELRR
jgi:hypothetical protein